MKSIAVPAVFLILASVLVVWLVQNEGGKLRQAVRESSREMTTEAVSAAGDVAERTVHQAGQDAKDIVKTAAEGAERTLEKAKEVVEATAGAPSKTHSPSPSNGNPGAISDERAATAPAKDISPGDPTPTNQEQKPSLAKSDVPAASPSTPTTSQPQSAAPQNQNDLSTTRIPSPQGPMPPRTTGEVKLPDLNIADPIGAVFKTGQSLTKTLDQVGQDLFRLDGEEEVRIGREVHGYVLKESKVWRNPRELARVERLAKPLLELRTRTDVDYKFTLLDDSEINAFSHLGGYVYFNRGLIQKNLSDAELQFVIGHEIAHVDLKHCAEKLTYSVRATGVVGDDAGNLVQSIYRAVALGYSEDQEYDADKWSFKGMQKHGRSKDECLAMIKRFMEDEALEESNRSNSQNSAPGKVVKEIRDHFASHPPTVERLKRLAVLP